MQMRFFDQLYRCQDCGQEVASLRKIHRFRICDACWQSLSLDEILDVRIARNDRERLQIAGRFWGWYHRMEQRWTRPRPQVHRPRPPRQVDEFLPYCERCGADTPEYAFDDRRSLFGGPRHRLCPECEAIAASELIYRMAGTLHPDWDDEDWLDLLYRSHPAAFEIGVLPGRWFEIKLRSLGV